MRSPRDDNRVTTEHADLALRALGQPGLMRKLTQLAIRSPRMGNLAMRVSNDLLASPDGPRADRQIYRAASSLARLWRDRT
ncbi:hypothetical protein [Candidatus Poriferisodalis sp.]|uniref:hypothetical protein n=1 Tax=Candidatus Poriferisodalis sp. TaxID=3101277 RepID=UPI003AF54484